MTLVRPLVWWWITLLDGKTRLETTLLAMGLCAAIIFVVLVVTVRRRPHRLRSGGRQPRPVTPLPPRAPGIGSRRVA